MTRTSVLAPAVLGALLLTACAEPDSSIETSPSVEASVAPTSEAPAPLETEEPEPEPFAPTFEEIDGIEAAEEGRGPTTEVFLPNGTTRSIEGVYEVDALLENPAGEVPTAGSSSLDCASQWGSVQFQWLRSWAEQPDLGFTEDYHYGATDGPTCFADSGGGVTEPDNRLIHHVCQSADTNARTLFSRPGGGPMVWTPETTTKDETVCFSFGEEVRAYQTEISSTQ